MPEVTSLHSKNKSKIALSPDLEASLIERLKRQDSNAFQDLINLHGDSIHNLVGRLMAFDPEMEDAIQNTWIQVWRKIATFRNESSLKTWITRIGAIDTLEADRVRLSVSKAKNSLAIHELRSQLAEAQHIALKDTNSVESETQIRRLTSRKDQIEKYIGELVSAMKDLYPREELLNRADRINQTIATLTKLVDEMETKRDEINGLLNTVNSEKSDEKKK